MSKNMVNQISGKLHWLSYEGAHGDYFMNISIETKDGHCHAFSGMTTQYEDLPIWVHFPSKRLYFPSKTGMIKLSVDRSMDDTDLKNKIETIQHFFRTHVRKIQQKNKIIDNLIRFNIGKKLNIDVTTVMNDFLRRPFEREKRCFSFDEMYSLEYSFIDSVIG